MCPTGRSRRRRTITGQGPARCLLMYRGNGSMYGRVGVPIGDGMRVGTFIPTTATGGLQSSYIAQVRPILGAWHG